VTELQAESELEAIGHRVSHGQPVGSAAWSERMATELGLHSMIRPIGRPKRR